MVSSMNKKVGYDRKESRSVAEGSQDEIHFSQSNTNR